MANGFSDLILEVFGEDVGHHARMAVGMATLPANYCVPVGAEVQLAPLAVRLSLPRGGGGAAGRPSAAAGVTGHPYARDHGLLPASVPSVPIQPVTQIG